MGNAHAIWTEPSKMTRAEVGEMQTIDDSLAALLGISLQMFQMWKIADV